jgi:hypothetical protein
MMMSRDKATGRYADSNLDKVCTCGHTLGKHTGDKSGRCQPCLEDGCDCECFKKEKR